MKIPTLVPTLDTEGRLNGWLMPIWNALDSPHLRPDQVYVTAIAPHSRKGPHLHMRRRGYFTVLIGEVTIVTVQRGTLSSLIGGEVDVPAESQKIYKASRGHKVLVLPGVPCALYNYGDTEALVLNMPSPAWSAEDQDDHPVTDWKDPEDWPVKEWPVKEWPYE
jgi:mannose-6-phosphate isomerase-like protein (cupin superfamily)